MAKARQQIPDFWRELAVLALFAALLTLGLAAQHRTLAEALISVGFLAAVLFLAWLWQITLQRAETARPLTTGGRVWNAAVFVAFLVVLAALLWHYGCDGQTPQPPPDGGAAAAGLSRISRSAAVFTLRRRSDQPPVSRRA